MSSQSETKPWLERENREALRMFMELFKSRLLVILENFEIHAMADFMQFLQVENLATILVSRKLKKDPTLMKLERKLFDLSIDLPCLSFGEFMDAFVMPSVLCGVSKAAEAPGRSESTSVQASVDKKQIKTGNEQQVASSSSDNRKYEEMPPSMLTLFDLTFGFPVAIGLARKSCSEELSNPSQATASAQPFTVDEWLLSDLRSLGFDPKTAIRLAAAAWTAISSVECQPHLSTLMFEMSIYAWPSIQLRTLLMMAVDEGLVRKLRRLEASGLIILEKDDSGDMYARTPALVGKVIHSRFRLLPIGQQADVLQRIFNNFCGQLSVCESEQTLQEVNAIALSAMNATDRAFFQSLPLSGSITSSENTLQSACQQQRARLCYILANFMCLRASFASSVPRAQLEIAYALYGESLHTLLLYEDDNEVELRSWDVCQEFTKVVAQLHPADDDGLYKKMYEVSVMMLTAAEHKRKDDGRICLEKSCVIALCFTLAMTRVQNVPWRPLYLSHANAYLRSRQYRVSVAKALELCSDRLTKLEDAMENLPFAFFYSREPDYNSFACSQYFAKALQTLGKVHLECGRILEGRICLLEAHRLHEDLGKKAFAEDRWQCLLELGNAVMLQVSSTRLCREFLGKAATFAMDTWGEEHDKTHLSIFKYICFQNDIGKTQAAEQLLTTLPERYQTVGKRNADEQQDADCAEHPKAPKRRKGERRRKSRR